jgi:hypothetical protein
MKFLSLILALSTSAVAYAGAGGHGLDSLRPDHGSAWFLQKGRAIKYCVEVSDKFGVDSGDLVTGINTAFREWTVYLHEKYGPIGRPINTQSQYVGTCKTTKGTEDLSFYFGTTNPEVEEAMKLYDHPLAFAHKTSYDLSGWGKGIIWATNTGSFDKKQNSPYWPAITNRYRMILHELGHVFGNEDLPGTIMDDQELAGEILGWSPDMSPQPRLGKNNIDGTLDLVRAGQGVVYSGAVLDFKANYSQPEAKKLFKLFVGKEPKGDVVVKYDEDGGIYQLADQGGHYDFRLQPKLGGGWGIGGGWSPPFGQVFKYTRTEIDPTTKKPYVNSDSEPMAVNMNYFTLYTHSGQHIAVNVMHNMFYRPVQIDAAIDGEMVNIFVSR